MRLFTSEEDVLAQADEIRKAAYWAEIDRIARHSPHEFGALIYSSEYYTRWLKAIDVLRFSRGHRWRRRMSAHQHAGESIHKFVFLSMLADCKAVKTRQLQARTA